MKTAGGHHRIPEKEVDRFLYRATEGKEVARDTPGMATNQTLMRNGLSVIRAKDYSYLSASIGSIFIALRAASSTTGTAKRLAFFAAKALNRRL